MNPFADMENDTVVVERDGAEVARYRCTFVEPRLTIMGDEVDILEGDKLFRLISNSERVEFDVEGVSYRSGLDDMCGCGFVVLKGLRAEPASFADSIATSVTLQTAQDVLAGNGAAQPLISVIDQMMNALNAMPASNTQKREATNLLRDLEENPLVQKAARIALPSLCD